jgi:hypothetical protein
MPRPVPEAGAGRAALRPLRTDETGRRVRTWPRHLPQLSARPAARARSARGARRGLGASPGALTAAKDAEASDASTATVTGGSAAER